jgi:nitroreductase
MVMTTNGRIADYPIDPMFLERWSPRAFNGEPINTEDLLTMLEAARWAASSFNSQPWRFVYARRDTHHWAGFLDLLVPNNQRWARDAAALVMVLSHHTGMNPRTGAEIPLPTHSFDAGIASGFFALQASRMGWFVHGMAGFDHERARNVLKVPSDYTFEAAFAVGRRSSPSKLPESLQAREHPSDRLPLKEIVFEGRFEDKS